MMSVDGAALSNGLETPGIIAVGSVVVDSFTQTLINDSNHYTGATNALLPLVTGYWIDSFQLYTQRQPTNTDDQPNVSLSNQASTNTTSLTGASVLAGGGGGGYTFKPLEFSDVGFGIVITYVHTVAIADSTQTTSRPSLADEYAAPYYLRATRYYLPADADTNSRTETTTVDTHHLAVISGLQLAGPATLVCGAVAQFSFDLVLCTSTVVATVDNLDVQTASVTPPFDPGSGNGDYNG